MTDTQAPIMNARLALGRLLLHGLEGATDTVHLVVGSALYSHDAATLTALLKDLPELHGPHPAWSVIEGLLCLLTGRPHDGVAVLAETVDSDHPPIRTLARIFTGACLFLGDDHAAARGLIGTVLADADGDHPWIQAQVHNTMGGCLLDSPQKDRHFRMAAAAFEMAGDRVRQGKALGNLAGSVATQGRLEEAFPLFEQAVDLGREAMRVPGAMIYNNWAYFLGYCGRWQEAESRLSDGIALAEVSRMNRALMFCRLGRAYARMMLGDAEGMEADVLAAQALVADLGAGHVDLQRVLLDLALFQRDLAKADGIWRDVSGQVDRAAGLYAWMRVQFGGIRLALCHGDADLAVALGDPLLAALEPLESGLFLAQTLYYRYFACRLRGDEAEAERCRTRALTIVSTTVWDAFALQLPPWARLQEERQPAALTVRMFGPLDVQTPSGRSVFGASQGTLPRQLLASLIVTPYGLTGEQLLQRLYDGNAERRKALVSLIHRLRDSLDEALDDDRAGPAITYTAPRYHLTHGWPLTSDLEAFLAAHQAWQLAVMPDERAAASERLIDLYAGPLLEDLPDEAWIVDERAMVREQWLSVVEWYLAHLARLGEIERALGVIERVATTDPAASRARLRRVLTGI